MAGLIHLGLSAIVYVFLMYLILFEWYPQPYFAVDGGWQGVQLLTGVDLVLGPVLTLMVYRLGKPGLKMDLTLIGLIQLAALAWGVYTVHDQRTGAVVFAGYNFETLNVHQVKEAGDRAVRLVSESNSKPPYVIMPFPKTYEERKKIYQLSFDTGTPFSKMGDRFEPATPENRRIPLQYAIDTEKRSESSPEFKQRLAEFLARHGGKAGDYAFVPLAARYGTALLVLDKKDASIVGSVPDGSPIDTPLIPAPSGTE